MVDRNESAFEKAGEVLNGSQAHKNEKRHFTESQTNVVQKTKVLSVEPPLLHAQAHELSLEETISKTITCCIMSVLVTW